MNYIFIGPNTSAYIICEEILSYCYEKSHSYYILSKTTTKTEENVKEGNTQ